MAKQYMWATFNEKGEPMIVANSRKELSELTGYTEQQISDTISKHKLGKVKKLKMGKIEKTSIDDDEKRQIVNEYLLSKLSGNRISMEALSRKYHHDQYKIKNILQESGAIEEVVALSLPEAKTRTWVPQKIIVQGKEYYDVSSAPTPDGFLEFGIESVKTQKFPEWKRELQRQWNRSNGRRGVNFGVEV